MGYLFLFLAIVPERAGTLLLQSAEGFTRPLPTAGCIAAHVLRFCGLSRSLHHIPLSAACATRCGAGNVAAAPLPAFLFREPVNGIGIVGLAPVIADAVLLNLHGTSH